jgi:hypothetical protein
MGESARYNGNIAATTWQHGTGEVGAYSYDYDANGNMTKDLNNGITGVSYNFLNLPRQVTKGE